MSSEVTSTDTSDSIHLSIPVSRTELDHSLDAIVFLDSLLAGFYVESPSFATRRPFSVVTGIQFYEFDTFVSVEGSYVTK